MSLRGGGQAFLPATTNIVSLAAVFSIVTQRSGGALRDDTKNGCEGDYYEHGPPVLSQENRRKIEPTATPSCLIPRLLVVFTQQLEILVTTLVSCHPLFKKIRDS